eukprot:gb/GEZN01005273.1/.p1 GENE.gb/GEZN01005273.1/~~gb/GEZN01005273.1/.p1  ORF type:complete len:501 (-),score=69.42 gb/GEZN01005273.1/:215-1717(-)
MLSNMIVAPKSKHARSLDDEDEPPLHPASTGSPSVVATVDPATSDICRRFLAVYKGVSGLSEGCYTSSQGNPEVFEVRRSTVGGDGQATETLVVTHRTETVRDLAAVTKQARHHIQNELSKRQQDINHLEQTIKHLQEQIREREDNAEMLLQELGRMLQVQGIHRKRIKELSSMWKVEVHVEVAQSCTRAELYVEAPRESTSKERRVVFLEEPCLYVLGGYENGQLVASAEIFNRKRRRWETVASLPTARAGCAAVAMGRDLFVLGGCDQVTGLAVVEKYDSLRKSWSVVAPMTTKRDELSAVVLDGQIYAIGGVGPLASVERYDLASGIWQEVAYMNQRRAGCVAAVLEQKIYVMGGWGKHGCLDSVECFDKKSNKWEFVAPMKSKRKNASVAVLNGRVYVMGGWSGSERLSSVERYDSKLGEWEPVAPMISPRCESAAVAFDGHIYVTGGGCPHSNYPRHVSVEKFDEAKNVWRVVDVPLPSARAFHAAVVALASPGV